MITLRSKSSILLPYLLLKATIALSAILVLGSGESGDEESRQQADNELVNSTTNMGKAPVMGSRSSAGGERDSRLPPWEFPIYCTKQTNFLDALWCGIGIRMSADAFLASIISMKEAKNENPPNGTSAFNLHAQTNWSILEPDHSQWKWGYKFKKAYKHNIALYKIVARVPDAGVIPHFRYPPPLARLSDNVETYCRLYNFGHKYDSDEGDAKPHRYPTIIHVREEECHQEGWCDIAPTKIQELLNADKDGALCGKTSDLGAPITCGRGKDEKLHYIVSEVETPTDNHRCSRFFKAINLVEFATDILQDVKNIDKL